MNTGSLIGRLTRDPEGKQTQSGTSLCKFGIAYSDRFNKEKTHFFDCTAFGKTADTILQYVKKGTQIGIEYSLNHNTWQTKDGQNRSAVSLNVNAFTFCGSKGDNGQQQNQAPQMTGQPTTPDFSDMPTGNDEVPF